MALLQEIKVPLLSVNDITLTVVELSYTTGAEVKKGDVIMVLETSKTTYDVEAETAGFVQYLCEPEQDYEVETVIAYIFSDVNDIVEKKMTVRAISEEDKIPAVAKPDWKGEPVFSADALSMIESRAMDKSLFMGRDFVNARDVEALLQGNGVSVSKKTTRNSQPDTKTAATVSVDTSQFTVEKISSNKKREINYLSEVQSAGLISMINTTVETDGIFARLNSSLKYFKDSLLPIVMYEVGRLLRKYPLLNAYYDNGSIAYYRNINVGFAVDIGKGLKVLQVPNTDQRSVAEIEQTILELSNKYLDDELQVEHLTNISFTVTDLSAEEVSFFFPLVNAKNSAILGISSVDRKLNRCVLTLSFDHRVTEGKSAAQFLHELKDRLESYQSSYNFNLQQNISCFKCGKSLVSDLSDVGFVKCISPQGSEGYICQSCFKGF